MRNEPTPRDEALRRMLVATVDAAAVPARRRWKLAALSIGAFALAGALTGGALGSVVGGDRSHAYEPFEIGVPPILDDDVLILGTPVVLTGWDPATLDLGPAAAGANGLALAIYCLEPGSYRASLDGEFTMGNACTPDSGPGRGGAGGVVTFDDRPPRELSIDLDRGGYAVWAAWVDQLAEAGPSAAQREALADGMVTREEYVAGFERYVACLADLGLTVSGGDTSQEIIRYTILDSTGRSGAADRCYEAEFHEVDATWQVAHER